MKRLPNDRWAELTDSGSEQFQIDRLRDEIGCSGLTCGFHIRVEYISALHDDWDLLVLFTNNFQSFNTIHLRHFDVEENEVDMFVVVILFECLFTRSGTQ